MEIIKTVKRTPRRKLSGSTSDATTCCVLTVYRQLTGWRRTIRLRFILFALLLTSVGFARTKSRPEFRPLLEATKASHSSAVVILRNGKTAFQYYSVTENTLIQAMSVTESVVALAFARLLSDGKTKSLDGKVYDYYPCWR